MELINALQQSPAFFLFTVLLFSLLVGSFLNVVILRLPKMMEADWTQQCRELLQHQEAQAKGETPVAAPQNTDKPFNLMTPASTCPKCGHKIRAWENIPIISYLLLKGKCANCKTHISIRYPLTEAATALLSVVVAWHFGFGWDCFWALVLTWSLVALTVIDFDTQLLPDDITLPLLWVGLLVNLDSGFVRLPDAVLGAIGGYLILWSVYWVFKKLTGKEGMGYGDFKLLAMLGAWMGWQALPLIILLSSLVGAVIGISLILFRGHDRNIPIPFGPYLAIAGWIYLLWGQHLVDTYFQLAGIQ